MEMFSMIWGGCFWPSEVKRHLLDTCTGPVLAHFKFIEYQILCLSLSLTLVLSIASSRTFLSKSTKCYLLNQIIHIWVLPPSSKLLKIPYTFSLKSSHEVKVSIEQSDCSKACVPFLCWDSDKLQFFSLVLVRIDNVLKAFVKTGHPI